MKLQEKNNQKKYKTQKQRIKSRGIKSNKKNQIE